MVLCTRPYRVPSAMSGRCVKCSVLLLPKTEILDLTSTQLSICLVHRVLGACEESRRGVVAVLRVKHLASSSGNERNIRALASASCFILYTETVGSRARHCRYTPPALQGKLHRPFGHPDTDFPGLACGTKQCSWCSSWIERQVTGGRQKERKKHEMSVEKIG